MKHMSRFQHFDSSASESSDSEEEFKVNERSTVRRMDSSDSEDEKRVVKTAKEKKFEEIRNLATALRNHKNNKDVTQMLNDFEQLIKCYDKSIKTIDSDKYAKYYIRVIAELEDFINDLWLNKKSLEKNRTNSKSLTSIRQRVKKYNKEFETHISEFRLNPDDYPLDLIEEEEKEEKVEAVAGDDDFDEDDIRMDDESSSSSSEDEEDKERYRINPADRFLKTTVEKKKLKKKDKKDKDHKEHKRKDIDEDEGWTNVDKHRKAKLFAEGEEITVNSILEKMTIELEGKLGKKDQKRLQLEVLDSLYELVMEKKLGIGLEVKLLTAQVGILLQYNSSAKNPCLPMDKWISAYECVEKMVTILTTNIDQITMKLTDVDEVEQLQTAPYVLNSCIIGLMEHIEDEYEKLLTHHDNSVDKEIEYIEKLKHESNLIELCSKLQCYMDTKDFSKEEKCRLHIRQVEHYYYRVDIMSGLKMNELCSYIIANDQSDRLRTRAMLCKVYYLAIHGRWFEARDLIAMSAIASSIDKADAATQILFNRVTVQLGLCAFKNGFIKEAHQTLADLQGSGRLKELLAQGLRMSQATSPEEIHRERAFLLPYHKHINADLIEGVYLLSAMITEVNNCFTQQPDGRRVIISRNFHHVLKNSEKCLLVGPPDNLKEHIVAASKSLFNGDWQKTVRYIFNNKMDKLLWKFFPKDADIKDVVKEKIKMESLKAFLHAKAMIFESLSLAMLEDEYELDMSTVLQVVSKMILMGKLTASLDEPSNCIIMHKIKSSSLQTNALKLSDKIAQLADLNEKLNDIIRIKN